MPGNIQPNHSVTEGCAGTIKITPNKKITSNKTGAARRPRHRCRNDTSRKRSESDQKTRSWTALMPTDHQLPSEVANVNPVPRRSQECGRVKTGSRSRSTWIGSSLFQTGTSVTRRRRADGPGRPEPWLCCRRCPSRTIAGSWPATHPDTAACSPGAHTA